MGGPDTETRRHRDTETHPQTDRHTETETETETDLHSPMAFLAQYLAVAPSVARSTGLQATETLGLIEAVRDAQEQLKRMGLSMDERAMPREVGSPRRELEVAPCWDSPAEKETDELETAADRVSNMV